MGLELSPKIKSMLNRLSHPGAPVVKFFNKNKKHALNTYDFPGTTESEMNAKSFMCTPSFFEADISIKKLGRLGGSVG